MGPHETQNVNLWCSAGLISSKLAWEGDRFNKCIFISPREDVKKYKKHVMSLNFCQTTSKF